MTEEQLRSLANSIRKPDGAAAARARERQLHLTKPPGSLGMLEDISVRIAAMTGETGPDLSRRTLVVAAADHGVAVEGVSAYPQEVTVQMVRNFLSGGAAINVFSQHGSIDVIVVDAGVAADVGVPPAPGWVVHKIGPGTRNIRKEQAMTRKQAVEAAELGIETTRAAISAGAGLIGTGDMGIANTTSAAAVAAVLTGRSPTEIAGRGTGIPESRLAHKIAVIEDSIALHAPDPADGLAVLAALGGFEIGCLAGVIIAAAAQRVPVVVDGFISTAAALVAARIAPRASSFMIAGHLSAESGHAVMLDELGLEPLLRLGMRLGEGTGAALAMHLVEAASLLVARMATFEQAGVAGAEPESR